MNDGALSRRALLTGAGCLYAATTKASSLPPTPKAALPNGQRTFSEAEVAGLLGLSGDLLRFWSIAVPGLRAHTAASNGRRFFRRDQVELFGRLADLPTQDDIGLPYGRQWFSLHEVSTLVDVKPHVVRFWCCEFKQLKMSMNHSGRRGFSRSQVKLILEIGRMVEFGLTISGVRKQLMARIDNAV